MLVIVEEIAPLPTCFLLHLPVPLTRPPRVTLRVKVAFPLVRVVCPYSLNVPLITPLPLQVPAGKPGFAAVWLAGAAAPSAATAAAVRKSFLNFMLPPWDLVRLNDGPLDGVALAAVGSSGKTPKSVAARGLLLQGNP